LLTAGCRKGERIIMLESKLALPEAEAERVARQGPWGAVALCLVATLIVVGLWFAFYFLAFLPRGHMQ
jgi:hypothetical protein